MMEYLYNNWQKSCLLIALFLFAVLFSSEHQLDYIVFLIWLQVPIYLLHEFEEHCYPGGFKAFINQLVFKSPNPDFPLNNKNIFWINIPFIWVLFPLFAILAQNYNVSYGAVLPYFALFNATLHIIFLIVKRRYNPGCIISIMLNYPTGIYTVYLMTQTGYLSWLGNLYGFLSALVGHALIFSYAIFHFKRNRAKQLLTSV